MTRNFELGDRVRFKNRGHVWHGTVVKMGTGFQMDVSIDVDHTLGIVTVDERGDDVQLVSRPQFTEGL